MQLLPSCTTGHDRELLVHLLFSRQSEEGLAPEVIRSAATQLIPKHDKKQLVAHNLVARLGASSNNGGTRPGYHQHNNVSYSESDTETSA